MTQKEMADVCCDQFNAQYPDLPNGKVRDSVFNAWLMGFAEGMKYQTVTYDCAVGDLLVCEQADPGSCHFLRVGRVYQVGAIQIGDDGQARLFLVGFAHGFEMWRFRRATNAEAINDFHRQRGTK